MSDPLWKAAGNGFECYISTRRFHRKTVLQVFPVTRYSQLTDRWVARAYEPQYLNHEPLVSEFQDFPSAEAAQQFLVEHVIARDSEERLGGDSTDA